ARNVLYVGRVLFNPPSRMEWRGKEKPPHARLHGIVLLLIARNYSAAFRNRSSLGATWAEKLIVSSWGSLMKACPAPRTSAIFAEKPACLSKTRKSAACFGSTISSSL